MSEVATFPLDEGRCEGSPRATAEARCAGTLRAEDDARNQGDSGVYPEVDGEASRSRTETKPV